MLKQRFLTAMCLIPLVLLLIYYGNPWLQVIVVIAVTVAMGVEWLQLIPIIRLLYRCLFILGLLLFIWLNLHGPLLWLWMNLMLWGLGLFAVVTYPRTVPYWDSRVIVGGACLMMLPTFFVSLVALHQLQSGHDLLLYLLLLVWATDIGAYFAGKGFGRHKLMPKVSPGKTIEGALGGLLAAISVAILGYFYFHPKCGMYWFGLAIALIFMSMLGDLFISMLKRRCHLKDTGQLLPGHGGVLDRLDSLIAALPLFYYGILWQQGL